MLTVSDLLFENGDFVLQLNYELARSWCRADKDPGGDRMQRTGARAALSLLTAARTRHWLPGAVFSYIYICPLLSYIFRPVTCDMSFSQS